MKKMLMATAATALMTGAAFADGDVIKLGTILGYTGPIESLTPHMAGGAELAMAEVSASGLLLGGKTVESVRADSTCVDSAAATAAAEKLITSDGVKGLMGPDCSGVTGAVLANVAVPNGIVMISPSATSPGLTDAEDNGLFFRTAPSDARQSSVMSDILKENGVGSVAVTYTNNDYGKGMADAFKAAFEAAGGEVTIVAAHEDGKADYTAEVGALASAGGDLLVVAGYVDQGGAGIVRGALDTGAFDMFHFPDGMIGENLENNFGSEIEGSTGQIAGTDSPGASTFADLVGDKFTVDSPYTGESYDAAALILLAMQAAGSAESADYASKVEMVANAPGEKIYPGELAKGLQILADGGEIDYVGATAVELINGGEASGGYREIKIDGGKIETVKFR
ncbi:ABC transporter substrate-binding protein [Aliiroseovarius sp. KMU-50]|uniref:ABC transporter substrate-binding protein n=1 Tax=Aliiroseovarius salicola TaxID=3009082 RepID=A0ABT4W345_9RHOB|nr:ABC transporter substrate-binding protein [Aliiroseovarius sp. KMU-50]MDA5094911.1 ABC transporter substrate-binding protein [Aliiroseovarius sp. KMU-50]